MTTSETIQNLPFVTINRLSEMTFRGGVYFVLSKPNNEILYVGSSGNLEKRWETHDILPKLIRYMHECPIETIAVHYLLVGDDTARLELEKAYIKEFSPLFNNTQTKILPDRNKKKKLNSFEILDALLDSGYAYRFTLANDSYKEPRLDGKHFNFSTLRSNLEHQWDVRLSSRDLDFAIYMIVNGKDNPRFPNVRYSTDYNAFISSNPNSDLED